MSTFSGDFFRSINRVLLMIERNRYQDLNVADMLKGVIDSDMYTGTSEISDTITTTSDGESSLMTPDSVEEDPCVAPTCNDRLLTTGILFKESILIFDYDDTLFPTTFLAQHGYRLDGSNPPPEFQKLLDAFSIVVQKTLDSAMLHGRVVIVTNAETGWIELTARKFMPQLFETLAKYPLISARSNYEPLGVTNPCQWKVHAFQNIIREHLSGQNVSNSVLSFGDSSHERDAVHHVCSRLEHIHCKSVKFIERPDIDQLSRQHFLIAGCLEQVVNHPGTLDLCIDCQVTPGVEPVVVAPSRIPLIQKSA